MADNSLAGLRASLRGELITRDDKEAFTAARFRGWNRDLNARARITGKVESDHRHLGMYRLCPEQNSLGFSTPSLRRIE